MKTPYKKGVFLPLTRLARPAKIVGISLPRRKPCGKIFMEETQTPSVQSEQPIIAPDVVARNYRFGALVAFLMTLSFVGGVVFGELQPRPTSVRTGTNVATGTGQVEGKDEPPPYEFQDVDFAQFWEVWEMVKSKHVDQPTSDVKMFYGAIAGMVGSLDDPYSVYFDPEFAQKFAQDLEGEFQGIGAEIGIKKEQLTVIAPLPGTPAEQAGLKAGDRIHAIDDTDTVGMTVEDAVSRIRGEKGTQVKLLVGRDGLAEAKEIVITRATIVVESVKWAVRKQPDGRKIGIITISHFNDNTQSKFNAAARAALMENPAGLVVDLRNDPGGYLDVAISIAGDWVDKDTVVIERFSDGTEKKYASETAARLSGIPTVVLVNGGSASASEIVAGALQDSRKAVIVGEQTFGKGSVQDYNEFNDGSALKLTIAKWLTPKGRTIDKEGLAPDIFVEMTPEDFNADRDPQMDKAIELLLAPGGLPTEFPPAPPKVETKTP